MQKKIPNQDLKEGYRQCQSMIEELIKSSSILLKENLFSISLSLAILAWEEVTKLRLIRNKIHDKEDILWEEWEEIAFGVKAHFVKLDGNIKKSKKNERKRG